MVSGADWFLKNNEGGKADRAVVRLEDDRDPFEHLPRRAHPRAQRARMGGGVMMGMVRSVGDRLRIDQPAEEQETDGQADRDGSLQGSVHGVSSTQRVRSIL